MSNARQGPYYPNGPPARARRVKQHHPHELNFSAARIERALRSDDASRSMLVLEELARLRHAVDV
jgi:hypothetical protein